MMMNWFLADVVVMVCGQSRWYTASMLGVCVAIAVGLDYSMHYRCAASPSPRLISLTGAK